MANEENLKRYLNFVSQKYNPINSSESIGNQGSLNERKVARLILERLKNKGYFFYRLKSKSVKKILKKQDKNRFYSRKFRNLYIYVEKKEDFLDINLFPKNLGLYSPESAWRIKDKMTIVEDIEEWKLDQAEAILQENGFKRWEHPENILLNYFVLGDFSIFSKT